MTLLYMFYMIDMSPWPLLASMSSLNFMTNFIMFFTMKKTLLLVFSFLNLIVISFLWWRDLIYESLMYGSYTNEVKKNFKIGMSLFILSEIMFFFSFFWGYFHSLLSLDIQLGNNWPPKGLLIFNPYNVPLLNTLILLSSGITVTWSHHSILNKNRSNSEISLLLTLILGALFSFFQYKEYNLSNFSISDSTFGSLFFMTTGFHGIHVILGSLFLSVNLNRMMKNQFSCNRHMGFEMSIWYWHFVDVVWLFLYTFMYWYIW